MEDNHTLKEHLDGIVAFADRLTSEWEGQIVPQVREALASSQESGIYTALEPAINSIRKVLWSILEPKESGNTESVLDVGAFVDASSQATLVLEVATAQQELLAGFKSKWENLLDQCDAAKVNLDRMQADISRGLGDTEAQLVIVTRRMQNVDNRLEINRNRINESMLARPMAVGREVVVRLPVVGGAVRQAVKSAINNIVGPNSLEQEREELTIQNHQNDFDITQLRGQLDRQDRDRTELVELESAMEQLRRPDGRLGAVLTEFDQLSQKLNEDCKSLSIRVSQIKGHIEDLIVTATEPRGGEMIILKAVEDLLRNIQKRDNKFYTMLDGIGDMVNRIRENQPNEKRRIEEHAECYSHPSHVFRRVSPPPSTTSTRSGSVWSGYGVSASGSDSVRSADTVGDLLDLEDVPETTAPEAPLINLLGEENIPQNPSVVELLHGLEISRVCRLDDEGEEPSLIDLDSDPQVYGTARASSRSLGFFPGLPTSSQFINEANIKLGGLFGELPDDRPSQTPPLPDEAIPEDLLASMELDVSESSMEEHINVVQPQEQLPDLQDDSQATSIHGGGPAESIVEDVTQGIGSENTYQATAEPPPNEVPNPRIPTIVVDPIDEPPPPSITPIVEKNHNDGDDDDDIYEDAPQNPSDITDIPGGQETGRPEDKHPGAYPLDTSIV
ncbi:unnamed protein product [Tuber aestivum]|uniref:Uncharacterized protein n=1 Tax=Tuber aestivum TaxID=59557 RepID=A0A292Q7U0_9PEZI|nr:unnamed protein product [Tuber aestivum]